MLAEPADTRDERLHISKEALFLLVRRKLEHRNVLHRELRAGTGDGAAGDGRGKHAGANDGGADGLCALLRGRFAKERSVEDRSAEQRADVPIGKRLCA